MVGGPTPAVARVLTDAARQMAADGGGLRYLGDTPDGYVRLQLTGACATCPRRMMTLDLAIETPLRAIGAARGVELVASAGRSDTITLRSMTGPYGA